MCRDRSLARRRMRRLQCGHFSLVVGVVASRSAPGRDMLLEEGEMGVSYRDV